MVARLGHGENKGNAFGFGLIDSALGFPALGSAILVLGSLGSIDVVGVHLFVLLLLLLRKLLPILTLLRAQALPLLADSLGKIGLALFLGRTIRNAIFLLTIFAALATEQNERILRSLDVVLIALLWPALDVTTGGRLSTFMRG